jgi:hypothetical protein
MTKTMAKSVALVAALTVGLAAVTQAETIGKAIGYTKIELPSKDELKLVTVDFNGESGGSMTLSEIFNTNTIYTAPVGFGNFGDRLYYYESGSGYTGYYKGDDQKFYTIDGDVESNPAIQAGAGFWIIGGTVNTGGRTMYISGQAVEEKAFDLASGLNLIGNGVSGPVDLVNDIDWTQVDNLLAVDNANFADRIYVYDNGYTGYYIANTDGTWKTIQGGEVVDSLVIDEGQGFWFIAYYDNVGLVLE